MGGMMSSDLSNLGLKHVLRAVAPHQSGTSLMKDFRVRQLSRLKSLPLPSGVIWTVTSKGLSFLS